MRAVNLIPADARVGGGSSVGRSGGAVYAVLGGLAVLVAMVALWTVTGSKVDDQRAELALIEQEATVVRARAAALQAPGAVQQTRLARTELVRTLASSRRDWAETLEDFSRTLPADVSLDTLTAASAPPAGGAVPGQAAVGPTLTFSGCAPSQRAVAQLMPRLRAMPDVVDVQLVSSAIGDVVADVEAACGGAAFSMNLELEAMAPPAATAAPGVAPAAGTAPPAGAPPVTGSAPPAGAPVSPATAPAPATSAPQTTPATATTAVPGTPSPGGTQ